MERLIEYVTRHPLMAAAVVLALVVVVTFESRIRASGVGAISTQDLIRLMNQGALVLDIRKPEEFAAGHVNGAKQLPSDQILTAGESFKRFKEKPVVVYCQSGSLAAAASPIQFLFDASLARWPRQRRALLRPGEQKRRSGHAQSCPPIDARL